MFNYFKTKNLNLDKKRLLSNFFSISSLEATNSILPLITLPYLVRVLGPDKFGLIAFAQAYTQYFVFLTDYGFNFSATRALSIARKDLTKVSKIFSSVMIIKLTFMLLSFIVSMFIVLAVPKFNQNFIVYFFTFGTVIGYVLFPIWFFQGMEKMKYITFINLVSRLIYVISIFIFIKTESDYRMVPLLNSIGYITGGLLSFFLAISKFGIKFKIPGLSEILSELYSGWHIFVGSVASTLCTTTNTFILGIFTNNTLVGYFSAAERLIRAGQRLINPISQAVYPYVSRLAIENREKALRFIRKLALLVGGGFLVVSAIILIFAELIIKIVLGDQFAGSVIVLKLLSFLPFIIFLSNIFGVQTMLTFDFKKAFSRILLIAACIDLTLVLFLVPLFNIVGASIAILLTEIFTVTTMFIYLRRKKMSFI